MIWIRWSDWLIDSSWFYMSMEGDVYLIYGFKWRKMAGADIISLYLYIYISLPA